MHGQKNVKCSVLWRKPREVFRLMFVSLAQISYLLSWCRQYARADMCNVCAFLLCYVWWKGEKKSRDKSRYEEHQKLSCNISPLVFYFKANNKKMLGVAAITIPWRQGHTAPHPAKQTSEAARREICDDKETNDDAAKDKRVAECSLSSLFLSSPLLGHKFKTNSYVALECMTYLNIVYRLKKSGIKKNEAKNLTSRLKVLSSCKGYWHRKFESSEMLRRVDW